MTKFSACFFGLLCCLSLSSCYFMSQTGPQKGNIERGQANYRLIPVNSRVDLPPSGRIYGVAQKPPTVKGDGYSDKVRERDVLRFTITDVTEASPFFNRGTPFSYGPVEVPQDGLVSLPYVGDVQVIGQTLAHIASELNDKLRPVSSTAQAGVTRSSRVPHTALVLGEVKNPGPVSLEKDNTTSLDLLAAANGTKGEEHQFKYTLRRNNQDYIFDYQGFRKNAFPVEEDDLLNVTSDSSNRFYVMGAINRPVVVPFPVPAPSLADAIGAASGFDERRSDPSGVFVFRRGEPDVVYTINLKDPASLLLTQRFAIRGEDIIYVTEAPLVRWSRLIQQILPISQLTQSAYYLNRINNE